MTIHVVLDIDQVLLRSSYGNVSKNLEDDMQFTLYTDYALRVLIYLSRMKDELVTINEVSEFYQVSENHLVKVVHHLAKLDFIHSIRGKKGGIKLARPPEKITIGEVVRKIEPNMDLVECFKKDENRCVITHSCKLQKSLNEALKAFLHVLDQCTLAEASTQKLSMLIGQSQKVINIAVEQ